MTVSSTAATAAQPGASAAPTTSDKGASALTSDFETFLKMLTAQAQNQDPLNPLDSSEYAAQLAQFSSVEQQVLTNDLLNNMVVQLGAMGMAQLSNWIGMEARVAAPGYFDGDAIEVLPAPNAGADSADLVVYNGEGTEVDRVNIPISGESYSWDGMGQDGVPLPHGHYHFEVESFVNEESVGASYADVYSRIVEATGENGDTVLVLEGGARISANQVAALREAT
ncbi:flagellar basal-body rod modification protein FlgD [Salinihabitans flavidus]|uniref:Basal-body rod modification protein FlgD n=1 Tax=Salinihabitans flavidus TaxID=569882 RepID=A0A1H8LPA2_9RHOB|nr:flagellar hook capping FlgD N-terminal domain-containing protein [Salinihabitans flavidus]SEO06962.1 flagellar basal-body rod modification protein FlgD [Salinihabitans flavidus]